MGICVIYTFKKNVKIQNKALLAICILWALLYGLRGYYVGNDTDGYAGYFDDKLPVRNYGTYDNPQETLEPGFILLTNILHTINGNATFLFLVNAFLMFIFIFYLYKDRKTGIWGLLCFFTMSMSFMSMIIAMRQSFAIISVLLSLVFLKRIEIKGKKFLKSLLSNKDFYLASFFFIFSFFIHRTSILLVPAIILIQIIQINKKIALTIISVVFVISTVLPNSVYTVFDVALKLVSRIGEENIALLGDRYAESFGESQITFLKILSWCIPMFITTWYTKEDIIKSFNFKCMLFSFVIYMLFSSSTMVIRLSMLFQIIGFTCFIPDIVYKKKNIALLYVVFTLLYYYSAYQAFNNWNTLLDSNLPYYFFWEK